MNYTLSFNKIDKLLTYSAIMLTAVLISFIMCIKTYAATTPPTLQVGDTVPAGQQSTVRDVTYPADGSKVTAIDTFVGTNNNYLYHYDDGTAVFEVLVDVRDPSYAEMTNTKDVAAGIASSWITDKENIQTVVIKNISPYTRRIGAGRMALLTNLNLVVIDGDVTVSNGSGDNSSHVRGLGVFYGANDAKEIAILKDCYVGAGSAYNSYEASWMFQGSPDMTRVYIGKNVTSKSASNLSGIFGWTTRLSSERPIKSMPSLFPAAGKEWTIEYEDGAFAIQPDAILAPISEIITSLKIINAPKDVIVGNSLPSTTGITLVEANGSSVYTTSATRLDLVDCKDIGYISGTTLTSITGLGYAETVTGPILGPLVEELDLSSVTDLPAIKNCPNLTSIKMDKADLGIVKDEQFYGNNKLVLDLIDQRITSVGSEAFSGIEASLDYSNMKTISANGFLNAKLTNTDVVLNNKDVTVGSLAFSGSNITSLVYSSNVPFNTNSVKGARTLTKLVILAGMNSSSLKSDISSTAMIYCEKDSSVETWCINNAVAYKTLTAEEVEGIKLGVAPKLVQDNKFFDFENPTSVKFTVSLGAVPAGATGISKVLVDNDTLASDEYTFNGTDTITIGIEYLKTLYNGTHSVSVLFNNGTFKSGASIYVMSSTIPVIDPTKPPVALDTVKYEFYKDYPDYIIIPVSLNGATQITKLKIGSVVVDPSEYELDEGAIIISYDFLSTLDAGKYRVMPTFNDPAITTLNNIQLLVYENAADRAAPYLLQTRIVFKGQDFTMKFDAGLGDLEARTVLALVVDSKMILQDGEVLPFSTTNVKTMQKSMLLDLPVTTASPSEASKVVNDVEVIEDPVTASPSEATVASPSEATISIMSSKVPLININDTPFYVNDNVIHVNGAFIDALDLGEGEHLIGAIFDNTEKTTDIKKVILSIESSTDNPTPVDPGTPTNPGDPTDNGGGSPTNPSTPGEEPTKGGSGSSGGSSSGGSKTGPGVTKPNVEDSKATPTVPNDGGSYVVNPDNPKDVTYLDKDGNKSPNSWIGDGVNWRRTDENSKLEYGWYKDADERWYLLEREAGANFGAAKYGWYQEPQDENWYYMSTVSTEMCVGWKNIDGEDYYFVPTNSAPTYTGDNFIGWTYIKGTKEHPVGKLLTSTTTPDGYVVDANGRKVK